MNFAHNLTLAARKDPDRKAIILASGESRTFRELEDITERTAAEFRASGIDRGARVVVLLRPGLDFLPALFALLGLGAIPVLIDPGMRLRNVLACLAQARPTAMVATPSAYLLSLFFPRVFGPNSLKLVLRTRRIRWRRTRPEYSRPSGPQPVEASDPAAIVFTSGSTGVPKGVEFTHGNLEWQKDAIRSAFDVRDDDVDLIVFPSFAAFTIAWGITGVMAPMSFSRPAKASGAKLAEVVRRFGVTRCSGSPAVFERLFEHCRREHLELRTLRRVLMTGAPVPERIIRLARISLPPEARIDTPYGATEALPVASIADAELLADGFDGTRAGRGTCVGRPLADVEIRVIRPRAGPIECFADAEVLGPGEIGEVVVRGPGVMRSYSGSIGLTPLATIPCREGAWHRMGDCGYLDGLGRLWFCGRRDHRFVWRGAEIFPVMWEGCYNRHPDVVRTALVAVRDGRGSPWPVLVVEPRSARLTEAGATRLAAELRALGPAVRDIVFSRHIPVDVRHNVKIDRIALGRVTERRLRSARWT
jgi:acyl-CoA synthetase (AMP-forming)/AMP-acid ligase II